MQRKTYSHIVLVAFLVYCALFICGCSLAPHEQFTKQINYNKLLTKEEEAYAVRMFDLINSPDFYDEKPAEEDIIQDPSVFESALYRKWGLGPKRIFSYEEKLYIGKIKEISEGWQKYSDILNDLTDSDHQFLKEMHVRYGKEPINLRETIAKKDTQLAESEAKLLMQIEAVCGGENVDDKGLVMLSRWTGTEVWLK